MTGHGCQLVHNRTGVLLEIKAFALTHRALAFAGDQIGQGIRVVSCHGSGMYLQVTKSTSCSQFRTQGLVQHEAHKGAASDVHSELFPGDDGLDNGLGGIKCMAGSLIDMVFKGI